MPRPLRVVLPGCAHHVWFRGNNRRRLFSYPRDYGFLLRQLAWGAARLPVQVHAWSLLPNHGHLVVRPKGEVDISALMKRVLQRYAQYRNKAYGASGKLFEQRFGCRPAVDVIGEAVLLAYVENNGPLAGRAVDPAAHRWCSFRLKMDPDYQDPFRDLWTPGEFWRALGEDAPREYRRWVDLRREHTARRKAAEREPARRPDGSRAR